MMNPVPWLQMTNMISYQGLVRTFPSAIELAITAMEDLINDYDREHTKFSGCHPRQGHASTLRQMQQIHKALKRGRT
ncbi:hypothetical protein KAF99_12200, partial [Klebsiella pneumoniae]|uniref:hypothetical protein n=1 Tax=Klebsiella pneumoniae TaxID=573 RepID=UPI001D47DBCA